MGFITIEELKKCAFSESFSNPYFKKLEYGLDSLFESGVIKNVVDNEHFFYPKYLWNNDNDIELYFFTKEKLIKCTYEEDGIISVRSRFIKDVSQLELNKLNTNRKDIELKISFSDGEVFTFTSNDSNKSWKNKFYNAVLDIYKLLS